MCTTGLIVQLDEKQIEKWEEYVQKQTVRIMYPGAKFTV